MATFKPGQRVVLAHFDEQCYAGINGRLGTFLRYENLADTYGLDFVTRELVFSNGKCDCEITIDGYSKRWTTVSSRLEPLLYDGNNIVAWKECEWQPGQSSTVEEPLKAPVVEAEVCD